MELQDIYQKAINFAAKYHKEQKIPGTNYPYIVHLSNVCMEVMFAIFNSKEYDKALIIQCALLHDVIEDTEITYQDVKNEFGEQIANGVMALTKNKNLPEDEQLSDSLKRIKQQPDEVLLVKMADRIVNLQPPPYYWNHDKIKKYQKDAIRILEELKTANKYLATRLEKKIKEHDAFSQNNV